MAEEAVLRDIQKQLTTIQTLLRGSNGDGAMGRIEHLENTVDELGKAQAVHSTCLYDPNKCAKHDKKIDINAVRISVITVGSSGITGTIIGVIMHVTS